MAESDFRRYIKKKIVEHVSNFAYIDITSIESYTSRGIPDLNMCCDGYESWVECKHEKGNQIKMRPEQKNWIRYRSSCGGNVYVLVKRQTAKKDCIELWDASIINNIPNNSPTMHAYKRCLIHTAEKSGNSYVGLGTIIDVITGLTERRNSTENK